MPLPMAKQEYLEVSTSVPSDYTVKVINIDADLFIFIDDSYREIHAENVGPESCVKEICVDEGDKFKRILKLSKNWQEDLFFVRPISTSPRGNIYTRAIVTMYVPRGTVINVEKLSGQIIVNDYDGQVVISK